MKYTLKGICTECGNEVKREYSLRIILGLIKCSDDYKMKMSCRCNKYLTSNVYKRDVPMLSKIREDKLREILDK